MNKLSSSAARGSFGVDRLLERRAKEGRTPENDPDTAGMIEYYQAERERKAELEKNTEWQKNNLEYDLRTTDWILAKVRASKYYAQNLYAAMCNTDFQRLDVMPILRNETWSCSWRYAGGIIADMREEGDYIDWYCSGIKGGWSDEEFRNASKADQERYLDIINHYVGEGVVTDEINKDLALLGWTVLESKDI